MTPTKYSYHQEGQPANDYDLAISEKPSTPNLFGLGSGENNVSVFTDADNTIVQYQCGFHQEGTLEVQKINGQDPPFPEMLVRTSGDNVRGMPAFRVMLSSDVNTATIAVKPIRSNTPRQVLEFK